MPRASFQAAHGELKEMIKALVQKIDTLTIRMEREGHRPPASTAKQIPLVEGGESSRRRSLRGLLSRTAIETKMAGINLTYVKGLS
jgi:hypothetical protein